MPGGKLHIYNYLNLENVYHLSQILLLLARPSSVGTSSVVTLAITYCNFNKANYAPVGYPLQGRPARSGRPVCAHST